MCAVRLTGGVVSAAAWWAADRVPHRPSAPAACSFVQRRLFFGDAEAAAAQKGKDLGRQPIGACRRDRASPTGRGALDRAHCQVREDPRVPSATMPSVCPSAKLPDKGSAPPQTALSLRSKSGRGRARRSRGSSSSRGLEEEREHPHDIFRWICEATLREGSRGSILRMARCRRAREAAPARRTRPACPRSRGRRRPARPWPRRRCPRSLAAW